MTTFEVTHIVDGDTFDVTPQWTWGGYTGYRVRAAGYDAPELYEFGGDAARAVLVRLILGEFVVLRQAYRVDRGRLVADVYVGGKNLAVYFG